MMVVWKKSHMLSKNYFLNDLSRLNYDRSGTNINNGRSIGIVCLNYDTFGYKR